MGSSTIRAMACGRPVIVQGGGGFSAVFDEETYPTFLAQGFYGTADPHEGPEQLAAQLEGLLRDPARRAHLGALGRQVAVDRYSLRSAAATLVKFYEAAITDRPARLAQVPGALSVGRHAVAEEIHRRWTSLRRTRSAGAS
jgi:glycosyltransferase involved in cell wall biosynthesis